MFTRRVAVQISRPPNEVFGFVAGHPTGMLRLLQPLIAHNTQKNLDRGFPSLKQVLEAGAGSGTPQ